MPACASLAAARTISRPRALRSRRSLGLTHSQLSASLVSPTLAVPSLQVLTERGRRNTDVPKGRAVENVDWLTGAPTTATDGRRRRRAVAAAAAAAAANCAHHHLLPPSLSLI